MRSTPGPQARGCPPRRRPGTSGIGTGGRNGGIAAPAEAMLHQPGGAVRALQPMPAMPAQRQRRIAAAIEEQHRLLPRRQRLAHASTAAARGSAALRRRRGADRSPRTRGIGRRHARSAGPAAVAPGFDIGQASRGGRGGNEHDRNARRSRAHDRHVARVVDHAVLLLKGGLVLLIDDDEAEIREGQEQRRSRADDDPRRSLGDRAPGRPALDMRQVGMPRRRLRAEARSKRCSHCAESAISGSSTRTWSRPRARRRPPRNRPLFYPRRQRHRSVSPKKLRR